MKKGMLMCRAMAAIGNGQHLDDEQREFLRSAGIARNPERARSRFMLEFGVCITSRLLKLFGTKHGPTSATKREEQPVKGKRRFGRKRPLKRHPARFCH